MFFLLFRSFEGAWCEWFPTFQPSSPKMLCWHGTRHTLVLLTKLLRCYCWQCWAHVRVSCNWKEWLLQKRWVKHWARTRNLHPTWDLLSLKTPWTKRVTEGTCRFVPCFVFMRDQWFIERLSWAMSTALVSGKISLNSSKNSFYI